MNILRGLLGLASLVFICWLFSANKKSVNWKMVGIGIILQITLALLVLKIPFVQGFFGIIVGGFRIMIDATNEASQFLFGELAIEGGPYGFAFFVLPTIIFFSALSSLLYYLGILQKVVYGFAWLMNKTMGLSGAESLAAAANVFIGQTEAPLIVKPYLENMTKSELLCLMTGGMATIAGGVFGAYLAMLGGASDAEQQKFGLHLLTASIISAPAAIVAAKILYPENSTERTSRDLNIPKQDAGSNFLDALSRGTTDGLKLAVNVGAMLLAFMAFIYFANKIFFSIGDLTGLNAMINEATSGTYKSFSLQYIMGFVFSPIAWLIGISSEDIISVGQMLGEKTILNEFVAYASLTDFKLNSTISDRSIIITTYALCGFANFASIGIQIGGIGAIAPGQRRTLTELGIKALIGGTVACLMTAAVAGMIF